MSTKSVLFIVLFLLGFGILIFQFFSLKPASISPNKTAVLPTEINQKDLPKQTIQRSVFTQAEWVEKKYAF